MGEYLLAFDLDKIHDYVFATGRLKEIRGGSALMCELTEAGAILDLLRSYSPREIYIDGGAGKVIISAEDDDSAWGAANKLEFHICKETISGSLTAVVVPMDGDFKNVAKNGDWSGRT
jgi:hypothetical protein